MLPRCRKQVRRICTGSSGNAGVTSTRDWIRSCNQWRDVRLAFYHMQFLDGIDTTYSAGRTMMRSLEQPTIHA